MERAFVAKWYHLIWYPDWFRRLHQRPQSFLADLVRPGMTVADIGCGLGLYSVELAKLVGRTGRVLAVDFQPQMLRFVQKKASRAALAERIKVIECRQDDIMVGQMVDFVLTMYVVHEVPDRPRFFRQVRAILKPDARYLYVEPKLHVRKEQFTTICRQAVQNGLRKVGEPKIASSRAVLFGRAD